MLLATRPMAAFLFAIVFLGGAAYLYAADIHIEESKQLIFVGFLVFFGLAGVAGTFWRFRIVLDLNSRMFKAQRGMWPAVKSWSGTFEDIRGIVLTVRLVRSDKSTRNVWSVSLDMAGLKRLASVFNSTVETDAYEQFERLARKLKVKALDRTGVQEKASDWNELDTPVIERAQESPQSLSQPPEESGIQFTTGTGAEKILLPAGGIAFHWLMLFVMAVPFMGFGLVMAAALVFHPERVDGKGAAAIVAVVFTIAGFVVAFLAAAGMFGRAAVVSEHDRLLNISTLFGRRLVTWKKVMKREVEDVVIKPIPNQKLRKQFYEVVVRSDNAVMRVGRRTRPEELEWLRDALLYLVRK